MSFLRRLVFGVAASAPPPVPPEPLPTDEQRAEAYARELHQVDARLDEIGERIREFRKFHLVTVPTRGKQGGVVLTERFLADETTRREELAAIWNSYWDEIAILVRERNRIQKEAAPLWSKK